jgi:hypothetical protein
MDTMTQEFQILENAVVALREQTGIPIEFEAPEGFEFGLTYALLHIPGVGRQIEAEVRKSISAALIHAFPFQVYGQRILVTNYVNRQQAEELKIRQIQFIDTAGNAFINQKNMFIYITGNRRKQKSGLNPEGQNRAFEPTGLKVIFALIRNPELIQQPYRTIAEKTGVANGAITWVMKGLDQTGFIQQNAEKQRALVNIEQLAQRWAEAFPIKLQPKLKRLTFQVSDINWHKTINPSEFSGVWGGELAAEHLTNYLRPHELSLYLPQVTRNQFIAGHRLRSATQGALDPTHTLLHIYDRFWLEENEQTSTERWAHPLLVFAELLSSKAPRNHETAQIIYDQYLNHDKTRN